MVISICVQASSRLSIKSGFSLERQFCVVWRHAEYSPGKLIAFQKIVGFRDFAIAPQTVKEG
jgi:hypothetical protein